MAKVTQEYPTKQSDDFGTILGNSFKLIGASWKAFRLNLTTFIVLYVVPLIVLLACTGFITSALLSEEMNSAANNTPALDLQWSPTSLAAVGVGILGIVIIATILGIAGIVTQLASVQGTKISVKEALNQSFPYFWQFLLLGILSVLLILIGLVALIIPGLLAIFFLYLATYILIDKNISAVESLKESFELTKANWKIVLAYFILTIAIQLPSNIPSIGAVIALALGIMYLCLPAILYVRMQKQNPVAK